MATPAPYNPLDILIVEDSPSEIAGICSQIHSDSCGGYNVRAVLSATQGLRECLLHQPDCLLLNLRMSELDGIAFLESLEKELSANFPIIVLADAEEDDKIARALQICAQDFLVKGQITPDILKRSIDHARERFRITRVRAPVSSRPQVKDIASANAEAGNGNAKQYLQPDGSRAIPASDIGKHKTVEKSQSLLAAIVEASADAIFYQDLNGIIRTWNQGAENTYGYSASEVVGTSFENLVPPGKLDEWRDICLKGAFHKPVQDLETVRVCKGGRLLPVAETFSAVRNHAGEVIGFSSIGRDISERKTAEEKLRTSEAQYRLLANAMPQIVYLNSVSGESEFVNERWSEYTGGPAEDAVNLQWLTFVHPDDRQATLAKRAEAVRNSTAFEAEYRLRRQDGEFRWHLSRAIPVKNAEGVVTGWIGTCTDIHDLKLADADLSMSEERVRLAQHASGVVIWDLDMRQDRYTEVPQFFEQFEFEPGTSVGFSDWLDRIHPDDRDRVFAATRDPTRCTGEIEFRVLRRDGTIRWYLGKGSTIVDAEGSPVRATGINFDITARKRAEAELKSLEQKLAAAEKFESIGVMAAGLAHDFNNLLVSVIGFSSLAQRILPPEHEARAYLAEVVKAGERAALLTSQLLAYAGKTPVRMEPVDVSKIAGDAVAVIRTQLGDGIQMVLDLRPGLITTGDEGQIRQTMINLLINAAESLGQEDGTISLSIRLQHLDAHAIDRLRQKGEMEPGGFIRIEVRDTGCGIDPGMLDKIFEPFFSTKFPGRGLGLAATAGIVKSHGGGIEVLGNAAKGSRVVLFFPVLEVVKPAHRRAVTHRERHTVLIVDDEETVIEMAAASLRGSGYRVLTANGGSAALELIREGGQEISVVLLDLTMPEMGGREVLRQIREKDRDLKVILSSGYSQADALSQVARRDIAGFLPKPYTPERLLQKIAATLNLPDPN